MMGCDVSNVGSQFGFVIKKLCGWFTCSRFKVAVLQVLCNTHL